MCNYDFSIDWQGIITISDQTSLCAHYLKEPERVGELTSDIERLKCYKTNTPCPGLVDYKEAHYVLVDWKYEHLADILRNNPKIIKYKEWNLNIDDKIILIGAQDEPLQYYLQIIDLNSGKNLLSPRI